MRIRRRIEVDVGGNLDRKRDRRPTERRTVAVIGGARRGLSQPDISGPMGLNLLFSR